MRRGVKSRVEGDAVKYLARTLGSVDPQITGSSIPVKSDLLACSELGRVETDILVLVGIVRVGARAEEREGESKTECCGAHVLPLVDRVKCAGAYA